MGTAALTVIQDEQGDEIAVLYRHYDGYEEGHGADLKECLTGVKSNGASCLAASIVSKFKTEWGNFYLYAAGTRNLGEEYIYTVSYGRPLQLKVWAVRHNYPDGGTVLFDGDLADYNPPQ